MNKHDDLVSRSQNVLLENYGRLPIAMVRGSGTEIWDSSGKRYIDFLAGFGAGGIGGHCHPKIAAAIQSQAEVLLSHGNLFTSEPQVALAEKLIEHSIPGKVFFCHSGAEADETALKVLRRATAPGRYKVISFDNCFHGRTMGGLSLCPDSFQEGFGPMLDGNIRLPFGDLEAVSAAIDEQTAGIFVEPIQGEGGINIGTPEFIRGLRELCDRHEILLVCDEVWSAPARTGKWFAYQHYGIEPDVIAVAKALGGGLPVAACIVAEKWTDAMGPGSHGCTMGGNPLCAAAALAALELVEEEQLCARAKEMEEFVLGSIKAADLPGMKDARGKGLMLGIEFEDGVDTKKIMNTCIAQGLFLCVAKNNVVRFAPPLNTPKEILEEGLQILFDVIRSV